MLRWVVWLFVLLLGCSGHVSASIEPKPEETAKYGFITGMDRVWVRGPWAEIRPSKDIDDIIDQLCPAVMRLNMADERDYGIEYCGALYSKADGRFWSSEPSPLSRVGRPTPSKRKTCTPPSEVRDVDGPREKIEADFHSHPWTGSGMSPEDRFVANQRYSIRIQFDPKCHIQKLIPYRDDPQRAGELYERIEGRWKLIGIIKPEDKPFGIVTPAQSN